MTLRYKITIEYDGTEFSGWQIQASCRSIQQSIEEAIEKFSSEKVIIHGAGRTDAGVHAIGQVAHFDLEKHYEPKEVQGAVNFFLKPNPIIITNCEIVDENFHARFSAIQRVYKYIILNRKDPSVFYNERAWHIRSELDTEKMQEAANFLIGKHDFTSFRASQCQAASPIKTIDQINIFTEDEIIYILVEAKSFLHHMVRNIVGSLILVGLKKWSPEDMRTVLEAKDRRKAGQTAPACGLYFMKVVY